MGGATRAAAPRSADVARRPARHDRAATTTLDPAISAAAITGCSSPLAASVSATAL
jgi:hypothetical protein